MLGGMARRGAEPLPRGVVWLGVPVACALLVAFFVYLGFPYDRLADWISWRAGQATGLQLSIGELEPRIGWLPGFEARDVSVVTQTGERIDLARAWVRPAWSLSWLGGTPALYADVEAGLGEAQGVVWLGDSGGYEGVLRQVDVARLPFAILPAGTELQGRLDADVDVHLSEAGPEGAVTFRAGDGVLLHPRLPVGIPFDDLSGVVELGDAHLARIVTLELTGPMLSGGITGTVGHAAVLERGPLELEVRVASQDPNIQGMLRSSGARLDPSGSALLRVTGSLAQPVVR